MLWFVFARYPDPEGGSSAFSLGGDTNLAVAVISDSLADTEAKACTLHKVVELDKALEDAGLLLLGDACACIFAIEVEPVGFLTAILRDASLFAIAHLDMPLVGIFYSIGDKIGEQLLDAALVKEGKIALVRILLDKLHAWFLHTLFECLTDVIEGLGDVYLFWEDGQCLTHA